MKAARAPRWSANLRAEVAVPPPPHPTLGRGLPGADPGAGRACAPPFAAAPPPPPRGGLSPHLPWGPCGDLGSDPARRPHPSEEKVCPRGPRVCAFYRPVSRVTASGTPFPAVALDLTPARRLCPRGVGGGRARWGPRSESPVEPGLTAPSVSQENPLSQPELVEVMGGRPGSRGAPSPKGTKAVRCLRVSLCEMELASPWGGPA